MKQNIDNIFLYKKHQTKNIKSTLGTHEALSLKAQDGNACRDSKFYAGLWLSLKIKYPADVFCIILDVIKSRVSSSVLDFVKNPNLWW